MSGVRKLQVNLEILRALEQVAPLGLMEHTLKTQVQILVNPTPLASEIASALSYLESNRFVIAIRGELESGVKWSVTDTGRAKLAELLP